MVFKDNTLTPDFFESEARSVKSRSERDDKAKIRNMLKYGIGIRAIVSGVRAGRFSSGGPDARLLGRTSAGRLCPASETVYRQRSVCKLGR